MSEESIQQQEFRDKVLQHMATQDANRSNDVGWQKQLVTRISSLERNGCFRADSHEASVKAIDDRVRDLETAPKKKTAAAIFGVGSAATIVAGLLKGIHMFITRTPQ